MTRQTASASTALVADLRGDAGGLLDELPEELATSVFTHCVVDRAAVGLLRAARVPRRQRARAGRHRPSVSAPRGRALRRRPADQDPRPGGIRPLVPCRRRAAGAARAAASGGRRPRPRPSVDALVGTERVLASVIEAVIGACYLAFGYEADGGRRRGGVRARDRGRAGASGRLQVCAAGATGAPRRSRQLRGGRRARPAARPHVFDQRDDRGRRGRSGHGSQQEGRRAGGRAGRARGARGSDARCT